jgi:hypothetical protein
VLAAAVCAPAASAATLVGFGAAPKSDNGPVSPGDEVEFTIRASGDGPSPYVVSVNGDTVAEGSAEPGVTRGEFDMPGLETQRDSVSVAVSLDDPDSEPRTVALDYRATAAPPAEEPSSGSEEPPAATPAPTQAPAASSDRGGEQRAPAQEAPGEDAAPAPQDTAPTQTAPTAPAGAAPQSPRSPQRGAAPERRQVPARARPQTRPRSRPGARRPAPADTPAAAPKARTRRAQVLRGAVGTGERAGLPQRGRVSAPRATSVPDAPAQTDAGGTKAPAAAPDAAEDTPRAATPPREAVGSGTAADDSGGGSSAMIFVLLAAALAALVAGFAAFRVHARSRRRYEELLHPILPEPPPEPERAPGRNAPLDLTGHGARDRER